MVLVVVRALRLVAGDAVADVDAREQAERDELVEHAVDRGAADAAAFAVAQLVLDVERRERAGLLVEQLDDRLARAAAPVAGVAEAARARARTTLAGCEPSPSMIGRSGRAQAAGRDVPQVGLDALRGLQQRRQQLVRDRLAATRGWRARRR